MTWAERLTRSPELYPLAVDPGADAVRFVPLALADYAAASFLDHRLPQAAGPVEWVPWADVRAAAAGLAPRCHFVFHISHVGSTLLARLFDRHPALFALREPAILRGLGEVFPGVTDPAHRAEFDRRLGVFLGLWSRTFDPGQTAVVKATSFVSEMAAELLARVPAARAVLMYVAPATFLRALLDGAMTDVSGQAAARLARLHRRVGPGRWRLDGLSPGECVAMSWLCEMLALHAASAQFPDRVLWVDFDRFLGSPAAGLATAFAHLGVAADPETVKDALAGPVMGEYAKAPGHAYDAGVRGKLLAQADRKFGPEVARGVEWLRAAAAMPAVRAMLEAVAANPTRATPSLQQEE